MCYWQRWAHFAALALAMVAWAGGGRLPDRGRSFVWLAGLFILLSGGIGAWHAGIEAGLFEGFTQCSSAVGAGAGDDLLAEIMAAPMVRCDQVQWDLFGISMAGWNAILSSLAALVILWLSLKRAPVPR